MTTSTITARRKGEPQHYIEGRIEILSVSILEYTEDLSFFQYFGMPNMFIHVISISLKWLILTCSRLFEKQHIIL